MPISRINSSRLPADFQEQLATILPSQIEAYNFAIQFIEHAATASSNTDVKHLSLLFSEDFQKRTTPRENFVEELKSSNEMTIQTALLRIFEDYTSYEGDYLALPDIMKVLRKPEYGCSDLPLNLHAVKNLLLEGFQGYQFEFEDAFSGDVEFTYFRILSKKNEDTEKESDPEEKSFEILKKALIEKLKNQPYATVHSLYQQIYEDYSESNFYVDEDEINSILDQCYEFEEIADQGQFYYRLSQMFLDENDPEDFEDCDHKDYLPEIEPTLVTRVRPLIIRATQYWVEFDDLLQYIQIQGISISLKELRAILDCGHTDFGLPKFEMATRHDLMQNHYSTMYRALK